MTVTRKLVVASALVATGLGVAKLLGEPGSASRAIESAGTFLQSQVARLDDSGPPSTPDGMRLVPDFTATSPIPTEMKPPLVEVAPPLLPGPYAPTSDAANNQQVRAAENPSYAHIAPRAKLRNEAPRPMVIESSQPAPIQGTPGMTAATTDPSPPALPLGANSPWPTSSASPPGFAQAPTAPATIVASYNELANSATTPIAPPPWPMPDEHDGPRRHVVVDGDSLARLAGRYLDDPRRSNEIYEANRGVLNNPDLLPIGVELVIPDRLHADSPDLRFPQSLAPRAVAIYAPASGRMVPVRPVPPPEATLPRAQLSRPLPVE